MNRGDQKVLNRRFAVRVVRRILFPVIRRLYPYGSERAVLFGPLKGYRFVVEDGHGFSYALGRGSYNFAFLSQQIRKGMVIYDVGANRGQVTLFFSSQVGPSGCVYAFEPAPIPFKSLLTNIELNRLSNVRACQAVVSRANGEESFTFFADRPTEGRPQRFIGKCEMGGKSFPVRSLTLDSFIIASERKPDILKIDVEGSAGDVLEGARKTIEAFAPSIYIELHNAEEQRAVRDELQSRGYHCRTMDGREVVDPTSGWASPLWCWRER